MSLRIDELARSVWNKAHLLEWQERNQKGSGIFYTVIGSYTFEILTVKHRSFGEVYRICIFDANGCTVVQQDLDPSTYAKRLYNLIREKVRDADGAIEAILKELEKPEEKE